jgi:hypothetical protein
MATVSIDGANICINETDEDATLRAVTRGLLSVFERMQFARSKGVFYGVVTQMDEETLGHAVRLVAAQAQRATNDVDTQRVVDGRELRELRAKVARPPRKPRR